MRAKKNPSAQKRAASLTIDADLLSQAKTLGINLSATLEQALAENKAAIEAYNEHVETHGVFSDGLRGF